jgi:RimJ/RimL family protein N-acetyltransferase
VSTRRPCARRSVACSDADTVTWSTLRTERLLLRRWREADRPAFHALNADPEVMATIGPPMSRAESDAFMNRLEAAFDLQGYGLWCIELDGEPIGYTGFMHPWFRDGVEIGWRISSRHWGRGYAPEAARACLDIGFGSVDEHGIGFDEVITFTAATNRKSLRVMDKLGFVRDHDGDFDHPGVPEGSGLRRHVLYRMTGRQWRSR